MKTANRVVILLALVATVLLIGCSSKGTVVSGGSNVSSSVTSSGDSDSNQPLNDGSNGDNLGDDTPIDGTTGH